MIILKNDGYDIMIGQTFTFRARPIGMANDGNETLPFWDCGKPYSAPVVKIVKIPINL
jgi:hypothetical protein